MPSEVADIRVLITSPANATHSDNYSPLEDPNPENLLFVAFFKTLELRSELLDRLRQLAKAGLQADASVGDIEGGLKREYVEKWEDGDTSEALVIAVRWWTQVKRKPYHAYSLKPGVGPYVTSCLVAFEEPDTDTMRFNLARALDVLERERSRVMDFFGWDGTTEGF